MCQLCPRCSHDNLDGATYCAACSGQLIGLLGRGAVLANRYQVLSVLGCGGMGAVYLAADLRIAGRQVAIKAGLAPQPLGQSQHELSLLANLRHPSLPGVSDQFVDAAGRQYIVMDYIDGETLEDVVARRGPLPEGEALDLAGRLLEVIASLHAQGIIHRDIKPANLRLTPEGKLYLVDFGIAKIVRAGQQTQTWARGFGSPGFAPIEQYGSGTDQRSDLYSIGALLYYLLAGQPPTSAVDRVAGAAFPPVGVRRPDVSAATQQLVTTALAIYPAQRYQSAAEMQAALEAARRPQPASRPKAAWVVFGALATIGVVALAAWLVRPAFGPATPAPAVAAASTATPSATPGVTPTRHGNLVSDSGSPEGPSPTPERRNPESPTPTEMPAAVLVPTETATATDTVTARPTSTPSPTASPVDEPLPVPAGPQQLTFGEGKDYQPVYHPDGRQIFFFSSMAGPWDLYVLTSRGVRGPLLPPGQEYHHPHFTPDGRELLYTANGTGEWQIYRCALPDCASPVQLTSGPGKKRFPVSAPDGRQIAYMCDTTGNEDICVVDAAGGNSRVLVSSPEYDGMQAYSPDGTKIVFQSGRDGNQEIYVLDLGNGAITRLTSDGERDASPTWSPDGAWIAFETHRDGNTEIYAMRRDGTGLRNLTQHPGGDWLPSFSPNGRVIVYQSNRDNGHMNLWQQPFQP